MKAQTRIAALAVSKVQQGYSASFIPESEDEDACIQITFRGMDTDWTISCYPGEYAVNYWDNDEEAMYHLYAGTNFKLALEVLTEHMRLDRS